MSVPWEPDPNRYLRDRHGPRRTPLTPRPVLVEPNIGSQARCRPRSFFADMY